MRYPRILLAASTVLAAGLIVIATAGSGAAAPEATHSELQVSYAKNYRTLTELRAASSAAVKVVAESQRSEQLGGVPTTVTTVKVTRTISGTNPGSSIEIRQLGTSEVTGNISKLMQPGHEYLVFLVPSTGADDAAPNRYLIAGESGLYELQGNQYQFRGRDLAPGEPQKLPTSVQAGVAEAAAAR
ncbi:hypothetical protein [Kribbella ginsengisoli]|uniref:Uncharacterized protein n=1 Tax=Kribbella ginsengisoli TaxID=363865 RepID=A0ABP6X5M0_9ACTN